MREEDGQIHDDTMSVKVHYRTVHRSQAVVSRYL